MKKVICIEDLVIEKCDDDGFIVEGEYFHVEKDSLWEIEQSGSRIIGGEVRLTSLEDNDLSWVEIGNETFKEHFKNID